MDITREVIHILDDVLSLNGRGASAFDSGTRLLGSVAELDSMAVVSLITALEDRFDIVVEDDEIDGETFATVGTLSAFVGGKLAVTGA